MNIKAKNIALGVFVGVLSANYIIWTHSYIYYHWNYTFMEWMKSLTYKVYRKDLSIQEFNNSPKKKYIIGCHGRTHFIPYKDLIDYKKSIIITVDINKSCNPYVIVDLSSTSALENFTYPVDVISLRLCNCCTKSVEANKNMFKKIHKLLGNRGELWI